LSARRWTRRRLRSAARAALRAGLAAADPALLVRRHLRVEGHRLDAAGVRCRLGRGTLALVAVGKAAGPMAREAERLLGEHLGPALAIAPHPEPGLRRVPLRVAGHPLPDAAGLAAALEVERLAASLGRGDTLLLLLSGGASALLPAPAPGIRLADKQAVTRALLRAGAPIEELNAVRKHLSRLKGGQLARLAAPARVVALVLSDVVGDDLATIGSGPTAPDPTRFEDALAVLGRRGVRAPPAVRRLLEQGAAGERPETPKPGSAIFRRVSHRILGNNAASLEAAETEARRRGLRTLRLTSRLEGEAREVARALVAVLHECAVTGRPARAPLCLLAGGETTVTVRGAGRGGRNQELAVACARPLSRLPRHAVVASLATDGVDGNSDAAGGVVDDQSLARAAARRLGSPEECLERSDSGSWLAGLDDRIVTGPTGTNVVDLVLLLCGEPRSGAPGRREDV